MYAFQRFVYENAGLSHEHVSECVQQTGSQLLNEMQTRARTAARRLDEQSTHPKRSNDHGSLQPRHRVYTACLNVYTAPVP